MRLRHCKQPSATYKAIRSSDNQPAIFFRAREIVDKAAETFQSDRYYKTMDTWKQLVFMLYGVVSKAQSLNSLCKCLLFLEQKLSYLGIYKLPASSTLSDANCKRPNEVYGYIYYLLLAHYRAEISDSTSGPSTGKFPQTGLNCLTPAP